MTSTPARVAACCLLTVHLVAALPGFFAPYGFARQNRDYPYAPPTRLHFVDELGGFHVVPFVYGLRPAAGGDGYVETTEERYPLRLFARAEDYRLLGIIPASRRLLSVDPPGRLFLIGTDGLGRDQFSRLIYGGTVSLFAGLVGAVLALALGGAIGALAGFYGGRLDGALMRIGEVFMALPWLYLLIAARAVQPLDTPPARALLVVILILGGFGWPRPARLIRGVAASVRQREHVQAARGFGASDLYLLRRHVLPRTAAVIWTQGALLVPQFILAEVGLSFLGVGVGQPIPSWGNMLGELQHFHVLTSGWWWLGFPGLALVLVVLAYHLLARGATVSTG
jgi:peptide/nickel transport system permease protein